jgi:iron complex transport system ATP-binding protein
MNRLIAASGCAGKIRIADLSFRFDKTPVLDSVSFVVEPGSFLSILGPNGSGKTTLLRLIARWLAPSRKAILIDQTDVLDFSRRQLAARLARVSQESTAEAAFNVFETVLMGRSPYLSYLGSESKTDLLKAEEALVLTDIVRLRDRLITDLSGGELKRVMLAQALAQDTSILLLDEPTAHLDLAHERDILSLLKKMQKEKGITVVAVFHDLNSAAEYSDRIILLKEGRVAGEGTPKEVITPDRIREVYGVDVIVMPHPASGRPCVL